jgi:transposase-like protein
MEDLGKRLCDVIQHAVNAAEPEVALKAVASLREDLAAFEDAQVALALRNGASYADVARMLGISRQAAHRRYKDMEDAEPPEGGDPPGRILVTSEARQVVRLAREEASKLGAHAVGTEHLLLGILRFGDGNTAEALKDAGVDLGMARENAQVTLVGMSTDGVPDGPRGISPTARAAFERSLHEAVARGDGYIGVEHLLIAAVRDDEGGAHQTLQALGVDPPSVVAGL